MPTSSIRFIREWREFTRPDGSIIYRPTLPVLVRGQHGFLPRYFLVDSGADRSAERSRRSLSMAPYELFRQLGRRWQDGELITLRGISQRRVCIVQERIHEVDILVPDADVMLRLPIVFARGNAPFVLGREGFFDYFDVAFEKAERRTVFQFVEPCPASPSSPDKAADGGAAP